MRILERNKQDLYFANPTSVEYAADVHGFKTGEKVLHYGEPVKVRMSMAISSGANNLGSQGMATVEPYGLTTGYTHRAVTEDLNCPMGETSIVWFGIVPTKEEEGKTINVPHNFAVVRKATSLNHLIYYLKEVDAQ